MTKPVTVLIAATMGLLFAAFAYSQNLTSQNQSLEAQVTQLVGRVALLEQRISAVEEETAPRRLLLNQEH